MARNHFAFAVGTGGRQRGAMRGWFGDLGRLAWGLLYWNARKTLFRLRGAAGPAPCQHPSDSGLGGETGCEACAGWTDPARFRRLCPLLAAGDRGRRVCSVDASAVRPFWGRAFLLFGGAVGLAVAVAVLGAFGAFRAVGYRVPLRVVAWPPAWHRVQLARADYFYRMALRTYAAGDVRQSFLALSQVYTLDPDNTNAARLLAQFTQIANPDYSDGIYSRLLRRRQGNLEETAQEWFRALLARGDFRNLGGLSAQMLGAGGTHVPAWTQGLLFSERMDGDPAELDKLLKGPGALPAEARSVLSLARALRGGTDPARAQMLALSLGGQSTPFEVYYSLDRLIGLGRGADVVAFLDGPAGAAMPGYDREALKLDAYSALGWHRLEQKEMGLLLDPSATAAAVTLICGHLIRHPNAESAEGVFAQLEAHGLPATADNCGPHMALLCMAGVNGLDARMKHESEVLGRIVGGNFAAWGRVREFFGSRAPGKNPAAFLPALAQLPIEVVYALFAHYHQPAAAVPEAPEAGRPPGGDGDAHA